jgi:hypothetical protein
MKWLARLTLSVILLLQASALYTSELWASSFGRVAFEYGVGELARFEEIGRLVIVGLLGVGAGVGVGGGWPVRALGAIGLLGNIIVTSNPFVDYTQACVYLFLRRMLLVACLLVGTTSEDEKKEEEVEQI